MVRAAAVALLAVGSLTACGGEVDRATARVEGLRAVVVERAESGGTWSARWRLCWSAVGGAHAYAVLILTSEGAGQSAQRVEDTCWSLTLATGVSRRSQLARQVALVAPSLSVSVAAVVPGGKTGPPSAALAVGRRYP